MKAPNAFGFDEERGRAIVKEGAENTDNGEIMEALKSCPVQAIEIEQ